MKHRIYNVVISDDLLLEVTFYTGEVKNFDFNRLCAYDSKYRNLLNGRKLRSDFSYCKDDLGIKWDNSDYSISSEVFWCEGILVNRVNIDDDRMRLARRLMSLRDRVNMTQKELEQRSGIHQTDISKIERGLANPSIETVGKLVKALGYTLDYAFKTPEDLWEELYIPGNVAEYLDTWKHQGDYNVRDLMSLPEGVRCELIDGSIYDFNAPSVRHQELLFECAYQISSFVRQNGGNCKPFISPLAVIKSEDDNNCLLPDLIICCNPDNIKEHYIISPDFVMEFTSPATASKDYTLKLKSYRHMGVKEYWIADLQRETLIVHNLEGDNVAEFHKFDETVGIGVFDNKFKINLSMFLN